MKKILLAIVLTIGILSTSIVSSFAAGCGKWEVYQKDAAYCHNRSCYKVIFWEQSWGQHVHEHRLCVTDSSQTYWEDNEYIKWDGCCED